MIISRYSKKNIALFIIIIGLLTACNFKSIELKSINSVKFEKNKEKNKVININITLYNPNNIKFLIKDTDINVIIKNLHIGKLQTKEQIKVKRKSKFNVNCKVIVKKESMLLLGIALVKAFGKQEVEVNLKGNMRIKSFLKTRNIEINHSEKIKI